MQLSSNAFFPVLAIGLVLPGCSSPPLKPIPFEQRRVVQLEQLRDLTSQYQYLSPTFEALAKAALSTDFILVENQDKFAEESQKFRLCQNPLRANIEGSNQVPDFSLYGDVERISYESAKDIDDRIVTYALSGLLGLVLSSSNDDMGVFLQYRLYLLGQNSVPVDTFVVYGAATGNPASTSREVLTQKANADAACFFVHQLVVRLIKRGILHPDTVPNYGRFRERCPKGTTKLE